MRIIISDSTNQAVDVVTTIVLDRLTSHPRSVIGLATGRTMEPVYAQWVKEGKERSLDFSQASFFMLDEYLNIDENHPSSFKSYISSRLKNPLNLNESQFAFPPVHMVSQGKAGDYYEELIKKSGGIDLQLLGIGTNGHIGFNEPGSAVNSRTRVVELTEETKGSNQAHFGEGQMPTHALSMGIGSILEAKELVLLATGKSKANAIKYLLNHHDDEACPATFLKSHPHFTLVLDPEAASKISLNI